MLTREAEKQLIFDSLKDALLILMEYKDFSKITIQELVDKAGVARSTFYRHFKNKLDLVRYLITDTLINFDKIYAPKTISERFEDSYMREVRRYVRQYHNQIKSIYASGLSYLYLEQLNLHLLKCKPQKLSIEEKIELYGLAGAQYNIIFNGFIEEV